MTTPLGKLLANNFNVTEASLAPVAKAEPAKAPQAATPVRQKVTARDLGAFRIRR